MDKIGSNYAVTLTLALYDHPFFIDKCKPEKERFARQLASVEIPQNEVYWEIEYSDEFTFKLDDSKGRKCEHFFYPRRFIKNEQFKNFMPTLSVAERITSFSSDEIIIRAAGNQNLSRTIGESEQAYSLQCKYQTRWEIGEGAYVAEIPILIVPGKPRGGFDRKVLSWFEFG